MTFGYLIFISLSFCTFVVTLPCPTPQIKTPDPARYGRSRARKAPADNDLMEPYRQMVDAIAKEMVDQGDVEIKEITLVPECKRRLAAVPQQDFVAEKRASPLICPFPHIHFL